jgi:hypothetical protein
MSESKQDTLTSFYEAANHFRIVRIPPAGNAALVRDIVVQIRHELRGDLMMTFLS